MKGVTQNEKELGLTKKHMKNIGLTANKVKFSWVNSFNMPHPGQGIIKFSASMFSKEGTTPNINLVEM